MSSTRLFADSVGSFVILVLVFKGLLSEYVAHCPSVLRSLKADNCGREGKNSTMVWASAEAVCKNQMLSITHNFHRKGHTHGPLDQRFAVLASSLSSQRVLQTPEDCCGAVLLHLCFVVQCVSVPALALCLRGRCFCFLRCCFGLVLSMCCQIVEFSASAFCSHTQASVTV